MSKRPTGHLKSAKCQTKLLASAAVRDNAAKQQSSPPNETSPADSIAGDLLRGVKAISSFVGLDERQCFYRLQIGAIPAVKESTQWVASKSRLRAFYNGESAAQKRDDSNAA